MKSIRQMTLKKILFISILLLTSVTCFTVNSQEPVPLRRPISPDQPMWLIHIDTWNYADPQKIIDLIPDDIKPFVVMNISISINRDETTRELVIAKYGYEIAKSWVRTCAENQMWCMVQQSSGGYAHFPDDDLAVYEEFYREYPNFIGFNYAEQFWGYSDYPYSPTWGERIEHFARLMELNHQYGGYLVVSWTGMFWGASINPIAMFKRHPNFAEACKKYPENYILCEKYTQDYGYFDIESTCLGAYLGGYSGQYGIRYDDTGWNADRNGEFIASTGTPMYFEHGILTGQTVMDGPELIWIHCFQERNPEPTDNGFYGRKWISTPEFNNVNIDAYRKFIDGTVRIPTREEVIERTKFVVINDVESGGDQDKYSSPETLFSGLYLMDNDGTYLNNNNFYKKTGRYPTIPTVFKLNEDDSLANSFEYKINKSEYSDRWPTISSKTTEFNNIFPEEYTGDIFAGRLENTWVTYNPYITEQTATGSIPFKYNTCEKMELSYPNYTTCIVNEYSDSLVFYVNNYNERTTSTLKNSIIKIYGSTNEPTYSYNDRGNHKASVLTKNWADGVFTLTVQHNGALDITVNCSGDASGRLTTFKKSTVEVPQGPPLYTGPRQYEAECFEYKNIIGYINNAHYSSYRNFTGQGILQFGTNSAASVRDFVTVLRPGVYQLKTRYTVTGDVNTIDLYVNGVKIATPSFVKTENTNTWNVDIQNIELNSGTNEIMFSANGSSAYNVVFDNIVVAESSSRDIYDFTHDEATTSATNPPAALINIQSGTAGVVSYTDADSQTSNGFKAYSGGTSNATGVADLDMFRSSYHYSVIWKGYYETTGSRKGVLLRANGENGSCAYAEGMKQGYLCMVEENADSSVTLKTYIAGADTITEQTTFTSEFKIIPGQACWYRATIFDDTLFFECSADSINWSGGTATVFSDNTYESGLTQLVWGLGTDSLNFIMDNISYLSGNLSVPYFSIKELNYTQGTGPSEPVDLTVSGSSLIGDIEITSPTGYEISLNEDSGYDSTLTLAQSGGEVATTTIFVRLKTDLPVAGYNGNLTFYTKGIPVKTIVLESEVSPQPTSFKYNFSNDAATTTASTPPAINTSIGQGNSATAGVVSYSDANNVTSNVFTPYGVGQNNSTGVVDLELFSNKATDYSVTWKQCVGSAGSSYKVGVLLRGDTNKIGDASTGYAVGLMNGYLFIVYTEGTRSEFRIYKSTETFGSLNVLINTGVNSLDPEPGQPVWYRASVSGSTDVSLKLEYSTDSITWNPGATTSDNGANSFKSGATQIVWGLAVTNVDFYMDDITFRGLTENSGSLPEVIEVSGTSLSGFNYMQGFGPSYSKSFNVWGKPLTSEMEVHAPYGFELALDTTNGFAPTITLPLAEDSIAETTIYVRLKTGLVQNTYDNDIVISSSGVLNRYINLTGIVDPGPEITVSVSELNEMEYKMGFGPSNEQSVTIAGTLLVDDIVVAAPDNFEISLTSGTGFGATVTLPQSGGEVSQTPIYVRIKPELAIDTYTGDITLNSTGAFEKTVSLTGNVLDPVNINNINAPGATVVSTEYYTLTGQKVYRTDSMKGIYIVKKYMSDGSVATSKIFISK